MSEKTRQDVLAALHQMAKSNNVIQDTHGNVSQIDDTDYKLYIKPSGMDYSSIKLYDVCVVAIDHPQNVDNKRNPSVDTVHHAAIYNKCSWIKAICHVHSPYATSYAGRNEEIRCYLTEHADYFGKTVRCLPYSDLNNWGSDIARILQEDEKAVLLGNHGVLTFGDTAEQAVKRAAALENIAMKNYLIEAVKIIEPLDNKEVIKWHERYNNVYGQ